MAAQTLSQQTGQDFQQAFANQQANAGQIAQDYLAEVRARTIAWGCNAACVDSHT